ncbi:tRNA (adenosine(37)-N6)-threonylcarbamoyltransferase complex dimerization subunit type 1 TsaB, partial [Francisella tularensis subsp. holarctica]|nr:tRNA (adenosine(37)-N6)-threonylcarbamoyltransferase complex dimerization subunit type 1 TsaB [Francisella tularensis subsp. holarctica]
QKVAVILDEKLDDFYLGLYDKDKDQIITENVYQLEEYSQDLYAGYQLVGESIAEIQLKNVDFKIDVANVVEYVYKQYQKQTY